MKARFFLEIYFARFIEKINIEIKTLKALGEIGFVFYLMEVITISREVKSKLLSQKM